MTFTTQQCILFGKEFCVVYRWVGADEDKHRPEEEACVVEKDYTSIANVRDVTDLVLLLLWSITSSAYRRVPHPTV